VLLGAGMDFTSGEIVHIEPTSVAAQPARNTGTAAHVSAHNRIIPASAKRRRRKQILSRHIQLLGLAAAFVFSIGTFAVAGDRPNVLFIAVDDLNHWVTHLGRNLQARTQNIDRLARRGVSFSHAYCAVPACEPSRVALLGGRRPWTSGCYKNGDGWKSFQKPGEGLSAQFLKAGEVESGDPIILGDLRVYRYERWPSNRGVGIEPTQRQHDCGVVGRSRVVVWRKTALAQICPLGRADEDTADLDRSRRNRGGWHVDSDGRSNEHLPHAVRTGRRSSARLCGRRKHRRAPERPTDILENTCHHDARIQEPHRPHRIVEVHPVCQRRGGALQRGDRPLRMDQPRRKIGVRSSEGATGPLASESQCATRSVKRKIGQRSIFHPRNPL